MKFDPTKGHSANYVADHIARIEQYRERSDRNRLLDSMWRIASHCDLFSDELNSQLTAKQVTTVERFINDFKVNHHRLVEQYRQYRKARV